ncbi:MAG: hypothetical protein ACM31L_06975 [Actinomycetota bacterium]
MLYLAPQADPTADTIGEGEADDGGRYVLKNDAHERPVRASEWLCTNIAEAVGFIAARPCFLEMPDGALVFGSRRLAGVAAQAESHKHLLTPGGHPDQPKNALPLRTSLSALYAFDMAFNNDDRHLNNYMFTVESGALRPVAFDFSRSLFWNWPLAGFVHPQTATRQLGAILRQFHGWDLAAAEGVITRLETLPTATVERFINEMPGDWLAEQLRTDLLAWWSGQGRIDRLAELREGLRDGSLL